jgi:hypothetical protein
MRAWFERGIYKPTVSIFNNVALFPCIIIKLSVRKSFLSSFCLRLDLIEDPAETKTCCLSNKFIAALGVRILMSDFCSYGGTEFERRKPKIFESLMQKRELPKARSES